MDPAVKQMWIDALRSGKYKQGTGHLRVGDQYCCLGVLCDLAVQNQIIQENQEPVFYNYGNAKEVTFLPAEVLFWAHLMTNNPKVPMEAGNGVIYESLVYCNDKMLLDFNQIADLIEKYL